MLYPLTFQPVFKERVWGGRHLEQLYHKPLPAGVPIGESWEITDRPEGVSVIANGPLAGRDLRWLMEQHRAELLGGAHTEAGRFPLLIKILDAQDKLSLQVHPPAAKAAELGGEPKTEMWYVAQATPDADIFVGLKHGVTPAQFERKIQDGSVADCFHRLLVKKGDVMFLPSGRVHALGAGSVIFEIQQNSDTTYRVFDWNRTGLDGRPRELHVAKALASIDFNDFEPALVSSPFSLEHGLEQRILTDNELFTVKLARLPASGEAGVLPGLQVIALLEGRLKISAAQTEVNLLPGGFCLLPACLSDATLRSSGASSFLLARPK